MRRFLIITITSLLAAAPLASAGPASVIAYLRDGPEGPLADGSMAVGPPESTDPSTRLVGAGSSESPSTLFIAAEAPYEELKGPVFVALWRGPDAVASGQLTAVLYVVDSDGAMESVAAASHDLSTDPSNADPTSLIADDPSDPNATKEHAMARLMENATAPPILLDFGQLDMDVPADGSVAIGLYLEASGGLPAPIGSMLLQYDGQATPSFAYLPWYAPDPPPSTTTSTFTTTASPSDDTGTGGDNMDNGDADPSDEDSGVEAEKKTPAMGLLASLALVGAAAYLVRRRG